MPKDCIPIREIKVGETDCRSLSIDDYSYRAAGQRFAEQYVQKNWEEEGKMTEWHFNLLYFFLGGFVWEFIPLFTEGALIAWKFIVPFLMMI